MNRQDMNIFIIDDDRSFSRSLKRLLDGNRYSAQCFESPQSFIDAVPAGQKGTAIVDLHMPQCDGFSLMELMQELHYAMPVIIVTGQTRADTRDEALRRGAIGFLQKPFSERSLLDLLELPGNELNHERNRTKSDN